jgi:hypothetical protein
MSYDARLARIEDLLDRADGRETGAVWGLPFFSKVRDAVDGDQFGQLVAGWELPRRIAFVLARAVMPAAEPELKAYAESWCAILWASKQSPQHADAMERLTDIRGRLRNLLIELSSDCLTEGHSNGSH